MEGSKYVTLACVPFALQDKAGEDFGIAQAGRALCEYINRHYPLLPIHYLAVYLDPRFFKFEPFVSRAERPMKLQLVKEMVSACAATTNFQHTQCSKKRFISVVELGVQLVLESSGHAV